MSAISITGLRKAFDDAVAVDGVNLEVQEGEICALLGPSGCGKTTTLRMLAGFVTPDEGTIRVGARVVACGGVLLPPEKRGIGMVFQDFALFPHLTVGENVGFGLAKRDRAARVPELLALVGLEGLGDRSPHELSGGQQQRVALARAIAGTPAVVLLDEPFSGLDAALRASVRGEVREILRRAGVTALFVTHDQEEALSLADTVAVMHDGRIEQVGTPEEVYGRPANHWVATFLGEADVLPGVAAEGHVAFELGQLPIDPGFRGDAEILVRPEAVALSLPVGGSRGRSVSAMVVEREFFGHDQLIHVELPSGRRIRSRSLSYPVWHPGDRVDVRLEGPVNVFAAEGR